MSKKIIGMAVLICILFSVSSVFVCVGETNNNKIVAESSKKLEIATIDETIHIRNLKSASNMMARSIDARLKFTSETLVNAGVEANIVDELSNEILTDVSNADNIQISKSSSLWGDRLVDEGTQQHGGGDFIIYTVLLSDGETIINNGIQYVIYEAQVWAYWSTPPIYRLTDVFAMTVTNDAVFASQEERFGEAILYYTDFGDRLSREYSLYDNDSSNILAEYSNWNFAMSIDLPNDMVDINGLRVREYTSMYFFLGATLYAYKAFNLYSAYGHKYIAGTASLTSDPGVAIEFGIATYNYPGIMLSSI